MSLEMVVSGGRRRLAFRVRPLCVPPSPDGIFGPGSVIRTLYADSVCLLGAGTALLLQLAHPSIAQGVHEHSEYESHPLARLFGTLFAVNTVVFGSRDEAARIGAAITGVHEHVTGDGYRALDPELLCWVNATLLGCAVPLYERIIRPFSGAERDELARDSRLVGAVFGCPIEAQPSDWSGFEEYWEQAVSSLTVSDTARRVAASLLAGRGLPLRPAWAPPLAVSRAVTAATLPPRIRDGYGLPWERRDQLIARSTLALAKAVLPRMPEHWRQLGPELLRSAGRPEAVAAAT